jgi:hypothetical protein
MSIATITAVQYLLGDVVGGKLPVPLCYQKQYTWADVREFMQANKLHKVWVKEKVPLKGTFSNELSLEDVEMFCGLQSYKTVEVTVWEPKSTTFVSAIMQPVLLDLNYSVRKYCLVQARDDYEACRLSYNLAVLHSRGCLLVTNDEGHYNIYSPRNDGSLIKLN